MPKPLDWYNEADIYILARIEAGIFLGSPCSKHEQEHFDILKDYFFNLWMNDFEKFKSAAEDLGYQATREHIFIEYEGEYEDEYEGERD